MNGLPCIMYHLTDDEWFSDINAIFYFLPDHLKCNGISGTNLIHVLLIEIIKYLFCVLYDYKWIFLDY